jgi:hypothetical protein
MLEKFNLFHPFNDGPLFCFCYHSCMKIRTMIAGMIAMCTSAFAGSTAGILDKPTEERMGAPAPAGATVLLGAGCDLAHW